MKLKKHANNDEEGHLHNECNEPNDGHGSYVGGLFDYADDILDKERQTERYADDES